MYKRFLLLLSVVFFQGCTSLPFVTEGIPYHPPLPKLDRIKVAFVLGGGGAKGMAHVGVIEELLAAGITPNLIVGCSAGAIVGGLYADNPDIHRLKRILMDKKREHLLNLSFNYLPFGVCDGLALQTFLKDHLRSQTFNELKIPFIAVATNLQFGDLASFGGGELEPAIRASAAFPGVFLPVKIQGQYFVDGGVANAIPVEVARQMGAEFVIAVELDAGLPTTSPTNGMGILKRCLEISLRHQSHQAMRYADYVIKVYLPNIGTFEDGINEHVYAKGREAGRRAISKILERLPREP